MRGYAASNVFSRSMLEDLERATDLVHQLPERDRHYRLIRCHEVVRAIQPLLRNRDAWTVQDGHYRTVEHTWLIDERDYILDVYSVARYPMVQLVDSGIHFHRDLFRPGAVRRDIRRGVVKSLLASLAAS